jgi:hypothetical protein
MLEPAAQPVEVAGSVVTVRREQRMRGRHARPNVRDAPHNGAVMPVLGQFAGPAVQPREQLGADAATAVGGMHEAREPGPHSTVSAHHRRHDLAHGDQGAVLVLHGDRVLLRIDGGVVQLLGKIFSGVRLIYVVRVRNDLGQLRPSPGIGDLERAPAVAHGAEPITCGQLF